MYKKRENVFVVNPVAGKRESALVEANIKSALDGKDCAYIIYRTVAPGDGEAYVRAYADKNPEKEILFIACGGDGTLNEVVNGAAGFDNVLVTHYPCGSCNDFIKSLGVDKARFIHIEALLVGVPRTMDMIECSGRYVLNICSVGLDARIVADVPAIRKWPLVTGSSAYMVATVINLFKRINQKFAININGVNCDGKYVIVVAANGSYYGSSFHPVPEAKPDDGVLDFLLVKKLSRFVVAKAINAYKQGRYREIMKYFTKLEGDSLLLESLKPVPVNLDGETIYTNRVDIRLSQKKLLFLVPDPLKA